MLGIYVNLNRQTDNLVDVMESLLRKLNVSDKFRRVALTVAWEFDKHTKGLTNLDQLIKALTMLKGVSGIESMSVCRVCVPMGQHVSVFVKENGMVFAVFMDYVSIHGHWARANFGVQLKVENQKFAKIA